MCAKKTLFLLLALGLFLAACGYNGVTTTGSSPTTTGVAATPTVATRLTPGGPGATSTPTTSAQGTPGQGVTVQTSASLYQPGTTIVVTISNHTAQTILFANHQTNCTVVLLQLQAGSNWQSIAPCKLMIVTKLFPLGANQRLSVSLKPSRSTWPAGTYRIAFQYESQTPTRAGSFRDVFSPLFRVS